MKNRKRVFSKLYIGLIIMLLYIPAVIVVVYSFNKSKSGAVWTGFTLDWYRDMASDGRLLESLKVSLQVAALNCVISTVLGTMGALAVSRLRSRARKAANLLMYIPLIIPEIIMGVALLMFFSVTPLKYGVLTMVLGHTTFCIPYVFILVTIRLKSLDMSLIEAARDLGAKPFKAFTSITMPMILPAILSGVLISVAMSLDDVVISSFVAGPESTTLPIRIFSMLKLGVTPKINALSAVMLLVMLILVVLLQLVSVRKKSGGRDNA